MTAKKPKTVKAFYLSDTPGLALKNDLDTQTHKVGVKQTAGKNVQGTDKVITNCGPGGLHACLNPVDCADYADAHSDDARLILVELSGDMCLGSAHDNKIAAKYRTPLKIFTKRETQRIFKQLVDEPEFTIEQADAEIERRTKAKKKKIKALENQIDKLQSQIQNLDAEIDAIDEEVNDKIHDDPFYDRTKGRKFAAKLGVKQVKRG